MACEVGLNGIDNIPYIPITRWSDFKIIVNQFTGVKKKEAKQMYSTIIIDEVYASSIYCQDYICATFGDGALTMADGDSKHNLYQLYEKEYFKQINSLTSAGYTIVFIAHEQSNKKTGYISPKGDKRCISPIIDKCDYVVYLKGNGVDSDGRVIKSSAYLAETEDFFARARIEETPTFIKEFTAENLEKAVQIGINAKRERGSVVTTFEEQQKLNYVPELNFDELKIKFTELTSSIEGSDDPAGETEAGKVFIEYWKPRITQVIEKHLGKDRKVSQCTPNQTEALSLIVRDLQELIDKERKE